MFGTVDLAAEAARDAAFPRGWFALGLSRDLGPGAVQSWRGFGRDFVLWRTEDGLAHLAHAECPHYGAHMGRGTLKDGGLACPIHQLRFDGDGACMPARPGKPAPDLRLRTYPLHEAGGVIHLWRDPAEGTPEPFPNMPTGTGPAAACAVPLAADLVREGIATLPDNSTVRFHVTPIEAEASQILAVATAAADDPADGLARLRAALVATS